MNLRPSGYEPDELIFRKILKTRNLRYHNGLAVLFHDHHVHHGDQDDHNLATFWLQWHECASEKIIDSASQRALRRLLMECPRRSHGTPLPRPVRPENSLRGLRGERVSAGVVCDSQVTDSGAKVVSCHEAAAGYNESLVWRWAMRAPWECEQVGVP